MTAQSKRQCRKCRRWFTPEGLQSHTRNSAQQYDACSYYTGLLIRGVRS